MVCRAYQAILEPSVVDLRAGVDRALSDDGGGGVAGLEEGRMAAPAVALSFPVAAQRGVDADFFRGESARLGICGDSCDVGGDFTDAVGVFSGQQASGWAVDPVSVLGDFRRVPQLHLVADECPLKYRECREG